MPSVSRSLRLQVAERAVYCCEYCRHPLTHSPDPFEVDHIQPVEHGGSSGFENLALACRGCNNIKSDRVLAIDPSSGLSVLLFHPRRDAWTDHFDWPEDLLRIAGLTAIGRATVSFLDLNRIGLINLRRALIKDGAHPPLDVVSESTSKQLSSDMSPDDSKLN